MEIVEKEEEALETQELKKKQISKELIDLIVSDYEESVNNRMAQLHQRFEVYISESRLPIERVITVLHMLLQEATDIAMKKYFGE